MKEFVSISRRLSIVLTAVVCLGASHGADVTTPPSPALPPLPAAPRVRLPGERPPVIINRQAVQANPANQYPPSPSLGISQPTPQFPGQLRQVGQPSGLPQQPAYTRIQLPEGILKWDADTKENHVEIGQTNAHYIFAITNVSSSNLVITAARTSCGCTVAKLPSVPWVLKPGDHGEIIADVDVRKKVGVLNKTVTVETMSGFKVFMTRTHIPHLANGDPSQFPNSSSDRAVDRARNLALAAADRQAVFKGDCATCHVEPAKGKMGEELFAAACNICHDGPTRASMVPELVTSKVPRDKAYWQTWITEGKQGGVMPAFSLAKGGPLSDSQIDSLVEFLLKKFPTTPTAASASAAGGTK